MIANATACFLCLFQSKESDIADLQCITNSTLLKNFLNTQNLHKPSLFFGFNLFLYQFSVQNPSAARKMARVSRDQPHLHAKSTIYIFEF